MNDIKTNARDRNQSVRPLPHVASREYTASNNINIPHNMERRRFFKYAAISGASMLSLFLVNKLTNIKNLTLTEISNSDSNSRANKLTKANSLAFTENNKEVVFYDKKGAELLIFEK